MTKVQNLVIGRFGDYVTGVLSAIKMATTRCLLCDRDVPEASFRRRIDSSPEVLTYARSMVGVQVGRNIPYTCRPCFFKLEKGSKAAETLRAITEDARKSIGLPQHLSVVVRDAGCDRDTQTEEVHSLSGQGEHRVQRLLHCKVVTELLLVFYCT